MFTVDQGNEAQGGGGDDLTGNKYFDDDLLKERMQVQKADLLSAQRTLLARRW